jgi:hypothetical protein
VVGQFEKQRALLPVGVIPKPRVFSSGARDLTVVSGQWSVVSGQWSVGSRATGPARKPN